MDWTLSIGSRLYHREIVCNFQAGHMRIFAELKQISALTPPGIRVRFGSHRDALASRPMVMRRVLR
jgi:hypothetical protein